tara:strand:+ start:72 stop:653 length:582 start_codon:yes stop_codon:yes gene_type:complete
MDKIFPYHIYKFKVPNYKNLNKNLISTIYKLRDKHKLGIIRSNYGGWHSDVESDKFKDISEIILSFYKKEILKNKSIDIELGSIWANINHKGCYNKIHSHGDSHYSGVYYIKTPNNSGNLYLINRETSFTEPFNYFKSDCADEIKYIPKEGDLYFFSGNLPHRTGINLSDEDRISISWNVNITDLKQIFKGVK